MELPFAGQIMGTALFFLGTWILSYCSKIEKREKERIKNSKYGRRYYERKEAVKSERVLMVRGTVLSLGGYSVAMAGILTFIMTTQWIAS